MTDRSSYWDKHDREIDSMDVEKWKTYKEHVAARSPSPKHLNVSDDPIFRKDTTRTVTKFELYCDDLLEKATIEPTKLTSDDFLGLASLSMERTDNAGANISTYYATRAILNLILAQDQKLREDFQAKMESLSKLSKETIVIQTQGSGLKFHALNKKTREYVSSGSPDEILIVVCAAKEKCAHCSKCTIKDCTICDQTEIEIIKRE